MVKKDLVVITVEEHPIFSLDELSYATGVSPEIIQEMINYGVIEPTGHSETSWRFNEEHLRRIKMARHLQQDLEVNLAGIALVLELMDQMANMRVQIEMFHKHIKF